MALAALVFAGAVAFQVFAGVGSGLAKLAALAGMGFVVTALTFAWDDGLVVGAGVMLGAYSVSLADSGAATDRAAPVVAIALLGVVEFGAWSLELRDGAEERPLARLPSIAAILGLALVASSLVLAVGRVQADAGLLFWAAGAAAAIALLGLIAGMARDPDSAT